MLKAIPYPGIAILTLELLGDALNYFRRNEFLKNFY